MPYSLSGKAISISKDRTPGRKDVCMNTREETLKVIAEGLGRKKVECPMVRMLADEVVEQFDIATDENWDAYHAFNVLVIIEDMYLRDKTLEALEVIRSAFEQMGEAEADAMLDMAEACGKVHKSGLAVFIARFLEQARYICLFTPYEYDLRKLRGDAEDE